VRIAEYVAGKADEIEAFIGLKPKALVIFALSAAGAAVVATGLYWGVFGFSHWRNEMSVAGKIMVAAATVPARAGAQCGQYVCPVHGAVGLPRFNAAGAPLCPVGGEVMQFRTLGSGQVSPAAFAAG
jgi:hypothetical protein